MPKNYVQPAKNRPALPKREPQATFDMLTTELDSTKEFDKLTRDTHLECNKILQSTQAAYVTACGELGLTPTSRKEVTV